MTGDGGNHHEKLELKRISCAGQLTTSDMSGTMPDPVCKNAYTRTFKPNEASCTLASHIRSYPPYHFNLHPPSLFLYHHRRTQS